jgi:hypothetical protein
VRKTALLLLLAALPGCSSGEEPSAPKPPSLTADAARELVVAASAIPRDQLQAIAMQGAALDLTALDSLPLSVLMLLPLPPGFPVQDMKPPPLAPDGSIWFPVPGRPDAVTFCPPESVNEIVLSEPEEGGRVVSGTFRFWDGRMVLKKVEFRAELVDGAWSVTEFYLPELHRGTRLEAGNWTIFERP